MKFTAEATTRHRAPAWSLLALAALAWTPIAPAQVESRSSWWVTVLSGQNESAALSYKDYLEGLGFLPVTIGYNQGKVDVLYGDFTTHAEALTMRGQLERNGYPVGEIIMIERGAAATGAAQAAGLRPVFRVEVNVFYDSRQAQQLKNELERAGQLHVMTEAIGGVIRVTVGEYSDRTNAAALERFLRERGYAAARVVESTIRPGASAAPAPAEAARPTQAPGRAQTPPAAQASDPVTLLPPGMWEGLTDEQKKQVLDYVSLRQQYASENVLAEHVIQLQRRLEEMEDMTRGVVSHYNEQVDRRDRELKAIAQLLREQEELAGAGLFEQALFKNNEILKIDPNNQVAIRQKEVLTSLLQDGIGYLGQREEIQRKYETFWSDAEAEERRDTPAGLQSAMAIWRNIKALDPKRYATEADNKLTQLEDRLRQKTQADADAARLEASRQDTIKYGMMGAIGLLAAFTVILTIRTKARERQIFKKLHEITQIRPMREFEPAGAGVGALGGGSAGLIGAGASNPTFDDPLDRMSTQEPPAASVGIADDPLGGSDDAIFGEPATTSHPRSSMTEDDPFGAPPATETSSGLDDDVFGSIGGDFDSGFGQGSPAPKTKTKDKSKTQAAPEPDASVFDDVFADLPSLDEDSSSGSTGSKTTSNLGIGESGDDDPFKMDDLFGTSESGGDSPAGGGPRAMTQPDEADSAISMDDILGVGSGFGDESPSSKAEDSASDFGVSALFEAPTGRSKPPSESRPKPDESDPFAGTPFADILGPGATGESPTNRESSNGPEPPGAPSSLDLPQMPDDDSAGGFSIPAPDADPFAGYAKAAADDIQRKQATSTGADPNSSTAIPSTGSPDGVVFTQNFAEDTVGDRPSGWEGDFPFASLEVRDDSPPKGAKKYLAFHKKIQGEGKVYFQRRFADLSGVIGVEFDLKCNQKNKFLLGFFVEKDEDFQQSVHTKILLSEAQTAPTILLHGEPAPYLLGSWAHVRYVIDLAKGKIDGYIDGTHIARGLKMPQRPKSLNTLAIRDSVNTTGELFIGNIEVKKIG